MHYFLRNQGMNGKNPSFLPKAVYRVGLQYDENAVLSFYIHGLEL